MMGRFVLQDRDGTIPVVLFADAFERLGARLHEDTPVLVKGKLRDRGTDLELIADQVEDLAAAARRLVDSIEIRIPSDLPRKRLLALRDLLLDHRGDVAVLLSVTVDDRVVRVQPDAGFRIDIARPVRDAIDGLIGKDSTRLEEGRAP